MSVTTLQWTGSMFGGQDCYDIEPDEIVAFDAVLERRLAAIALPTVQVAAGARDLSRVAATVGSRLHGLAKLLMQLILVVVVAELVSQRRAVPDHVLVGLFIIAFGWWITVVEMRRKARKEFGL